MGERVHPPHTTDVAEIRRAIHRAPAMRLLLAMAADGGDRSPTEWAELVYPGTRRHSSYTSPLLLRLFERGLVVRTTVRGRVTYRLTPLGEEVARG